jgi:hypothetical protein
VQTDLEEAFLSVARSEEKDGAIGPIGEAGSVAKTKVEVRA